MGLKSFLNDLINSKKDTTLAENKVVKFQVSSAEYYQKERKRTYDKSGGVDNTIESKTVKVQHEKNNKHDPNALAVYVHGIKIGYIYKGDQEEFISIKKKTLMTVRQFYYNDKYLAELIINYQK